MNRNLSEKMLVNYIFKNKEKHYRIAYSYMNNTEDALDAVQEAVYKAFSAIGTLNSPEYIKTWFYRILVNTSLNMLRNQKRLVVDDEAVSFADEGLNDTYEDIDLKRAMDSLPEHYKSIIILRFFEDLKIQEIAEILNINIGTVKTRLYKSLDMLRIQLNEDVMEA